MPTVTLKRVSVGADSISVEVETDIIINGQPQTFGLYLSRSEATIWMQDNSKTLDDFILFKVQTQHALMTKLAAKAQTLVNKVLTW